MASLCVSAESLDLGGNWERRLGGVLHDYVHVPSSYRPVGTATLARAFEIPAQAPGHRAILRFEGVAHQARVLVNGQEIGRMGAWTPYEFDVTAQLRPRGNEIQVEVSDWQTAIGSSAAWEAYGGIIRDVRIDMRPATYVENAHVRYSLDAKLERVSGAIDVFLNAANSSQGKVTARLMRSGVSVLEVSRDALPPAGPGTVSIPFELARPELWYPDRPALYEVRISLDSAGGRSEFSFETGFRDVRISGAQFQLNGERLVLRGVNRHDLWHNQGHTLTSDQIERDLRTIKGMGANFVRLAHYPHDRRVVEWASRIGLFVTEESGLVWVDTRKLKRETIAAGLDNLERTVRRDWNAPSVFALLLANESAPDPALMKEFVQRMRPLATGIFLSTARLDAPEKTNAASKRMFDEAGLDFYTTHPYSYSSRVYEEAAREFTGRPLVFTEWGGSAVGQSAILLKGAMDAIAKLVQENRLSGHAFWSWADLPEFSRGGDELEKGILISGVVAEDRTPKPDVYLGLASLFRRSLTPSRTLPGRLEISPSQSRQPEKSSFVSLSLNAQASDAAQTTAWSALETQMEQFWKAHEFTDRHWDLTGRKLWFWEEGPLLVRGIPFNTPSKDGRVRPLVLTAGRTSVEIPINRDGVRTLHVLGNVTLPDGYPMRGRVGDSVGRYVLHYGDDERQEQPIRLGMEAARANLIAIASRVDPIAVRAGRAAVFTKDPIREAYQVLLLSLPVKPKRLVRLTCEFDPRTPSADGPPPSTHHDIAPGPAETSLLLFAVTAELDGPPDR